MKVDYKSLGQIALDIRSRNQLAKDTSTVLANYLFMLSNLSANINVWSVAEMAMITNSLNRWQDKKAVLNNTPVTAGDIVMIDFGLRYAPELSYAHPALVLESWKNLVFVIPATSSPSKLAQAYHPIDNSSGKWYYRKVGAADGFAHSCVLIINNAKIISKSAILSPAGTLKCDLNEPKNLFNEIKDTLFRHLFTKVWSDSEKLAKEYNLLQGKFDILEKEKNNEKNEKI